MEEIIFEDVADQYIKGEDVIVHFSSSTETKINPDEDQIGLIRIGSTPINECLVYAKIQLEKSGPISRGKATFSASQLTMSDDEFYQFCFLKNKQKLLGTSIPFQLNCSPDDVDLLSNTFSPATSLDRVGKESQYPNSVYSLPEQETDDLVVIQTKRMLTEEKLRKENRQLLDINRMLELENDQQKLKLEALTAKSNEYINKTKREMENLVATHKATIDELSSRQQLESKLRSEHETLLGLCSQYQKDSLINAERCQILEDSNEILKKETSRLTSQLASATSQIADLEKKLVEANESLKSSNQSRLQLEKQLKDLFMTSEKYQKSVQGKLDESAKRLAQQENQIHALETANVLLKDELKKVRDEKVLLFNQVEEEKKMKKQLEQLVEKEKTKKTAEKYPDQTEDYRTLLNSITEIKNRCIKHQKGEIEVKKQLTGYKEHVTELEQEIQELKQRLLTGGDEYKILYRKYSALERMWMKSQLGNGSPNRTTLSSETGLNEEALVSLLRNSYQLQQQEQEDKKKQEDKEKQEDEEKKRSQPQSPKNAEEIRECPMCYWQFPTHFILQDKKEHIEAHFD